MKILPSSRRKPETRTIWDWAPTFVGVMSLLALSVPLRAESAAAQDHILSKVGFTQNLDAQIPLDLTFRDESGQTVPLSSYFNGKPVILSLVYFECPMLCTESLNGLVRAIRSLSFDAGKQYNIVTVSFDPKETSTLARAKKRVYVDRYGRASANQGWAFLTGDAGPIHKLTDAAGFHFTYDPELGQYAHGTGILVLTPTGKISHYLFGVEYSARDLKLSLMEAASGKIGSPADQLLLYCYHYDPMSGKYNLRIWKVLRLAGAVTLLGIGAMIGLFLRWEKKKASPPC